MDTKRNSILFHYSFVPNIDTVSTEVLEWRWALLFSSMEVSLLGSDGRMWGSFDVFLQVGSKYL